MRFPPANVQLRRAQLVLMLAVLVPTVFMIVLGIILLVISASSATLTLGILVLAGCATGITGYILGSIFVERGASLAQAQNDFVSAVSHELRTPITSIRLFIDALSANRLSPEETANVLSLLAKETTRLDNLVARVLELTKIQTSAPLVAGGAVDAQALIAESISAFDAATLAHPVKISVDCPQDVVIRGDRSMLVRALVNLLTNAWKYTAQNKLISISVAQRGRWVEIAVRDNGPGLGAGEERAIFEQFARGRAAEHSTAQGFGLGLAFVRAIVRTHRGKLFARNLPQGGAEFRMRLRVRRSEMRAMTTAATLPPPHGANHES